MDNAKTKSCTDSLKRLLSLLVVFVLLFTAVSGVLPPVEAEATTSWSNFSYKEVNGGFEITGYSGPGGRVEFPETYNGKAVVGIGNYAFNYNNSITEIIIPRNILYIGTGCFQGCESLRFAYLSEGVVTIRQQAFYDITTLYINIPASVTSIVTGSTFQMQDSFGLIDNLTVYTPANSYAQKTQYRAKIIAFDQKTHTHTGEKLSFAEPTCTADGYETLRCTNAGCRLDVTTTIPKLNHDFSDFTTVTKAGCTTTGERQRVCNREGCYYVDKVSVNATGHKYGSWTVTKSATCTTDGEKTRKCSITGCGVIDKKVLNAKGHNMSDWVTKKVATCVEQGSAERKCTRSGCSYKETKALAYGKHVLSDWNTTKTATCVKQGTAERKCTLKGCTYKENKAIVCKAHTYKNVTTAATLKKDGKIETRCSACGNVSKTTVIHYPETIKLSKYEYPYTGKTLKPAVIIKDSNGNTLKSGTDYTVTFSGGCKTPGKYTVKITFKGKYSGTKTLSYSITPSKVSLSKVTAGKNTASPVWKTVTGASGYEVQYSTSRSLTNAKSSTVSNGSATKTTIKKLTTGKTYYVRVRAFKTVDGKKIYGAWSAVKSVKIK